MTKRSVPVRVTVLDDSGVNSFELDREPAWLLALSLQLDQDRAADEARFVRAYAKLRDAVLELEVAA